MKLYVIITYYNSNIRISYICNYTQCLVSIGQHTHRLFDISTSYSYNISIRTPTRTIIPPNNYDKQGSNNNTRLK